MSDIHLDARREAEDKERNYNSLILCHNAVWHIVDRGLREGDKSHYCRYRVAIEAMKQSFKARNKDAEILSKKDKVIEGLRKAGAIALRILEELDYRPDDEAANEYADLKSSLAR